MNSSATLSQSHVPATGLGRGSRIPLVQRLGIPNTYLASWVVTVGMTLLAAAIRLSNLNQANGIMFDETYYVKDGWSLGHMGYEGVWQDDQNGPFAAGDTSGLTTEASYVVHPPVGRWLIAVGMMLFGQDSPVGWRFSAAVAGIVGVILVCRLAWNLFNSVVVTLLAGLFLSTDGIHVVMSRAGLLDIFLSTFVLAAFLAVTLDQKEALARLRGKLQEWQSKPEPNPWGPTVGRRPWLLVAGVLLGLACGTKWSGIYAVAVLGLFVVLREMLLRRRFGVKHWFLGTIFPDGLRAFIDLVVVAAGVYLLTWFSWFVNPGAWGHSDDLSWAGRFNDWIAYHLQMWDFHNNLSDEHTYMSNPLLWLVQARPTSFWYEKNQVGCVGFDGADENCVSAITALGNPLLWWVSIAAILVLLWATLWRRNWKTGLVLCGFLAMYVPWFAYLNRTIFTFYTVAFVPFVALSVAWLVGWMAGQVTASGKPVGESDEPSAPGVIPPPVTEGVLAETTSTDGAQQTVDLDSPAEPSGEVLAVVQEISAMEGPVSWDLDEETTAGEGSDSANVQISFAQALDGHLETEVVARETWAQKVGPYIAVGITLVIVASACWFAPIWTGEPIPHELWYDRMWFSSWI